jgi:hypothetical protein
VRRERGGGSLMPAGLGDTLTRQEFVDLIRFLSELGKPGAYGPDTALVLRRWRVLDAKAAQKLGDSAFPEGVPQGAWAPAYTLVSGVLPTDAFAPKGQATAYVQGELDVTAAGRVGLHLGDAKGITLWIDGRRVDAKELVEAELAKGVHTLTFRVNAAQRGTTGLRVELRDVPGSTGHAQPVAGR